MPILLFSCTAEDTPNDPIIGSWGLLSVIEIPETGNSNIILEADDCGKKESMTFKSNGELQAVHYYKNEIMECKLNENATRTYEWTKVSEGIYNLKTVSSTGRDYRFSFPDQNTMWMHSNTPYERDGVKYSDTREFKRK